MHLTNCPACQRECSVQALTCPNCGHPFIKNQTTPQAPKWNAWKVLTLGLGGIILVAVLGGLVYAFFGLPPKGFVNTVNNRNLNAKQEALAQEAIAELRKLAAATDVGISKASYSAMLIPAKAVAERAVRELPDGELKKGIADTFDAYKDAHVIWDIMKEDTGYFACLNQPDTTGMNELERRSTEFSCDPIGGELARKYRIPIRNPKTREPVNPKEVDNKKGFGEVTKSEGLSIIWTEARLRLEVTSALFSKLTSPDDNGNKSR